MDSFNRSQVPYFNAQREANTPLMDRRWRDIAYIDKFGIPIQRVPRGFDQAAYLDDKLNRTIIRFSRD